jgi:hypothetical protein
MRPSVRTAGGDVTHRPPTRSDRNWSASESAAMLLAEGANRINRLYIESDGTCSWRARVNRWSAVTLILCRAGSPARLALHPQRTRADRSHLHMAARRPACRREIQSRDVARRRDRGGRFGLSAAFNGATVSAFVFLSTINSRRHTPHRYTTPGRGGSPLKAC